MSDPLVWLPFDPDDLGEVPAGLRYEEFHARGEVPDSVGEVAFYVPSYGIGSAVGEIIPAMSSLRVVQTLTAGVDHIRGAVPDSVTLCNGRGIHDASTAELAVALTLASLRDIPRFVRQQDTQTWRPGWRLSLADRRVLIVGYGQIGAAIEARLTPFEVSITRVARTAKPGVHAIDDLPALLPDADVVILIVPGTEQTRHLVDADFLAGMPDGALLVNLARGSVVDQGALLAELESGRLHAATDVTDPEPLPAGHPLWSAPNFLLSPHVGGMSSAMWPRVHRLVREQLTRFAAGEELVNQMTGAY